jgi:hypothetical protein
MSATVISAVHTVDMLLPSLQNSEFEAKGCSAATIVVLLRSVGEQRSIQ